MARAEVRKSNAMQDLARAIEILGEIKRLHIGKQWAFAHDRYSAVRTLIIEIRTATNDVIRTSDEGQLNSCIQSLAQYERDAARYLRDGSPEPKVDSIDARVREMESELSSVLGWLQSQEHRDVG